MKLTFLGTSAGKTTAVRNVSGMALTLDRLKTEIWLFDCGEATQIQFHKAHLHINKLTTIFITHMHIDHVMGLIPLLNTLESTNGEKTINLYGPKGIKEFVEFNLKTCYAHLEINLVIHEFDSIQTILKNDDYQVETFPLVHRCPSYAFRVTSFRDTKKVITIFGDTEPNDNENLASQDADVVVHEATYTEEFKERAQKYGHSTALQVACMANSANVKRLILTHISSRFQFSGKEQLILQEAKNEFNNTDLAADFLEFYI